MTRFTFPLRRALFCAVVAAAPALLATPVALAADTYPAQPIRLVVPFPPAGGTDVLSRVVFNTVGASSKWTVVVENRAGAGGNIGLDLVSKAKADGYTLGMGQTANLAINPTLYPKMPYDAVKDFAPVALVAAQPVVLIVRQDAPYKSLADLVAAAKAKQLSMASAGTGTVGHLTGEMFQRRAGIKALHVPYKGASPALTDLMGGQTDFYFATPPIAMPMIKAGKLRALAVTSPQRVDALPDVPTAAEAGLKDFEVSSMFGIVAPANTPAPVIDRLNAELKKILAKPEVKASLLNQGAIATWTSPADASARVSAEVARWTKVIDEAGVKGE